MIRQLSLVLSAAMLLSALTSISNAQAPSCEAQVVCSAYSLYYAECVPALPPGAHSCGWNGPWSELCYVPTYQCSPRPCPTCNGAAASRPIDLCRAAIHTLRKRMSAYRVWEAVSACRARGIVKTLASECSDRDGLRMWKNGCMWVLTT